jgi:hypothetical protein
MQSLPRRCRSIRGAGRTTTDEVLQNIQNDEGTDSVVSDASRYDLGWHWAMIPAGTKARM